MITIGVFGVRGIVGQLMMKQLSASPHAANYKVLGFGRQDKPKKVVKKESSKAKKSTVSEIKKPAVEEPKQESKRLLTKKSTATLYFICGGCWLISAILYSSAKQQSIFDFILAFLFIGIGVLYLLKDKKEKENK